jgi:hypothetical protein
MTDFNYKMELMEEGRIRFIISLNDVETGSLYFERAKRGFNRKPIGMDAWVCVDAKIEKLYEVSDYEITPKQIMETCQKMINNYQNGGE